MTLNSLPSSDSPRSKRQSLQLESLGFYECEKGQGTDTDADDVHDVVPIRGHDTIASTLEAPVFVCFQRAGERLCHWGYPGLEGGVEWGHARRIASRDSEEVDESEDEESWKSTAEIGDAGGLVSKDRGQSR